MQPEIERNNGWNDTIVTKYSFYLFIILSLVYNSIFTLISFTVLPVGAQTSENAVTQSSWNFTCYTHKVSCHIRFYEFTVISMEFEHIFPF